MTTSESTNKPLKLSEELQAKVDNMTPFQRKYCEYRAKGLKQPDAAEKAGSDAKDRGTLGRVGYNTEQMAGVKEYIQFLQESRARSAVVDNLELIEKLRKVYEEAMSAGKFADANKAVELLGNMIGAFKPQVQSSEGAATGSSAHKPKNNTKAFTEEREDLDSPIDDRLSKLQNMMRELNKGGNVTAKSE